MHLEKGGPAVHLNCLKTVFCNWQPNLQLSGKLKYIVIAVALADFWQICTDHQCLAGALVYLLK
jgi:hypothetical protein